MVLAGGGEAAELDTREDGTNAGGQIFGFDGGIEELGEGFVGGEAVLGVSEGFEGRVFLGGVPGGEVVLVLERGGSRCQLSSSGSLACGLGDVVYTLALGTSAEPSSSNFLLYECGSADCSL